MLCLKVNDVGKDFYWVLHKSGGIEYNYILNLIHKEDIGNHIMGKPLKFPMLDYTDISNVVRDSDRLLSYLEGSVKKTTKDVLVYGKIELITKLYEIVRSQSLTYENMNCTHNGVKIETVSEITGRPFLKLPYVKNSHWFVNSSITSVVNTFRTLEELCTLQDLTFLDNKDYRMLSTIRELRELKKNEFDCLDWISIDAETDGTDLFDHDLPSRIVSTGLSWRKNQAIVIPTGMMKMDNLPLNEVIPLIKPMLESKKVIMYNAMFDMKAYWLWGIMCKLYADPMVLIKYLRPITPLKELLGLKYMTKKDFGANTLSMSDVTGGKGNETLFKWCDVDTAIAYSAPDPDYTAQLFFKYWAEMPQCFKKVFANTMLSMRYMAIDEFYGVPCNIDYLLKGIEEKEQNIDILQKKIFHFVGQQFLLRKGAQAGIADTVTRETEEFKDETKSSISFQITSNAKLKKTVFEILKYPPTGRKTDSGQESLGKADFADYLSKECADTGEWKDSLIGKDDTVLIEKHKFNTHKYPFIYLVQMHRDLTKDVTSFLKPIAASYRSGRVFTSYSFIKADTGRYIDKIQTLKKKLKECIVETNTHYMIKMDYKQQEIRAQAGEAHFSELIDRLEGRENDGHREIGSIVLNKPPHEIDDIERGNNKAVTLGLPYGVGLKKLTSQLRDPVKTGHPITERDRQEVELIDMTWREKMKPLVDYLDSVKVTIVKQGWLKNAMNRVLYYCIDGLTDARKAYLERQGGNHPIQSFARDMLSLAMTNLRTAWIKDGYSFQDIKMPLNIHDEVVIWARRPGRKTGALGIHPYHMYAYLVDQAFIKFKGHPTYYGGISMIHNWLEGKEEIYEAPVNFVYEKVKEWKEGKYSDEEEIEDPQAYVKADILAYMKKRYLDEFDAILEKKLEPSDFIDADRLLKGYDNYFLRGNMGIYIGASREINKKDKNDLTIACLEQLYLNEWGRVNMKYKDEFYQVSLDSDDKQVHFYMSGYKAEEEEDRENKAYDVAFNSQRDDEEKDDFEFIEEYDENGKEMSKINFRGIFSEVEKIDSSLKVLFMEEEMNVRIPLVGAKTENIPKILEYLKTIEDPDGYRVIFQLDTFYPTSVMISRDLFEIKNLIRITGLEFTVKNISDIKVIGGRVR